MIMGKVSSTPKEDRPLSAVIKIAAVLVADILLRFVILPDDFLRFHNQKDYFSGTFVNTMKEPLTLSRWFTTAWNQNIRSLTINLFILGLILLVFRFRFKRTENFQLSRRTVIIALSCLAFTAIGYSHMMYNAYLQGVLVWQYEVTNILRVILLVALFEELIHRGFITNVLFRLKPYGLKTATAIAISAVIFGLMHLPSAIQILIQGGSIPFIVMVERTLSSMVSGVSYAVMLYYRKDIVSLICIHAAHNFLVGSYTTESVMTIVFYWVFYALFIIGYPVLLIFRARKKVKI